MNLNNVFLFTGEEKYLLDKEINRRKDNFVDKFGVGSLAIFDYSNFNSSDCINSIYGGGLFVDKHMVIIKGLPQDTFESNKISADDSEVFFEHFKKAGGKIPENSWLIFVSYKPDNRSKFIKYLNENILSNNIKTFTKLKGIELKNFIKDILGGIKISDQNLDYFLLKVGNDLYRIFYELEKLKTWCKKKNIPQIDDEIIDYISFGLTQTNAFAFFENYFSNRAKSIEILDSVKNDGVVRNLFAGALYYGLKTNLFIIDLYKQGIKDPKQIAKIIKLHPFSVIKSLNNIKDIKKSEQLLKKFYINLIELDSDIKTGKYPNTYFWLGIKKMIIK